MIQESIHKVIERTDLTKHEAYECFMEIMGGKANDILIASFLTALRMKGETPQEIAGAAQAMREMATPVRTKHPVVVDTCGTGGDGLGTFNISTAAAIVASAAGAVVAKHGNRAISSKCGSADVLKALGVRIDLEKEHVERCLDEVRIAFLFAPMLHGAMKYAMPVRRELGMRTIFNVLGPLTNPAGAKRQVIGVFRRGLTETIANVLLDLGTEHAFVVHGTGGMDEISTIGETRISEVRNGAVTTTSFLHESVGIRSALLSDLAGGTVEENGAIIGSVLEGTDGAPLDIVVLNAAAAIVAAGLAGTMNEGVAMARSAVKSGAAKKKLRELVDFTNAIPHV